LRQVESSSVLLHLEMAETHLSFNRSVPGLAPPLLFLGGTQPKVPGMACIGAGRSAGLVWYLGDGLRCSLGLFRSASPSGESCCGPPPDEEPTDGCRWDCPSWNSRGTILCTCSKVALAVASKCKGHCCCCCSCCCVCCCAGCPNFKTRGTIFGAFGGSLNTGSVNSRCRVQRTCVRLDADTEIACGLLLTGDAEEPRVSSWRPVSCVLPCLRPGDPGIPRATARCRV